MTFHDLGLSAPILKALSEQGYVKPSPIQEKAIPPALQGRDVLGCAQTGTGKTCAFAAPILQRLSENPKDEGHIRALILTPTRELAIQIGESFESYSRYLSLRYTVIFGGVSQNPQVAALKQGTDILVATPGRLMDLHNQGHIALDHLEIFVLDEADRMLDMGFIHDVKKILKWLPREKQTLLFSATMPAEITHLVDSLLKNPVRVAVNPVSSPVEAIQQSVYMVDRSNKTRLLAHLVKTLEAQSALVFTRTKHGANKVARDLGKAGITAAAIHGNKSQTARQQALSDFKSGKLRCLVATDIAARGLDIEELSHVFNYNLPEVPETYVHRIGRTGRAGRGGEAIAFCDFSEKPLLKEIEKLMGKSVPLVEDHPFPMEVFEAPKRDKHGKIINPEDDEARQAARELKKAREEAKAAKQESKTRGEAPAPEAPAVEEGAAAKLKRRRRKKKPAQPAEPSVEAAPVREEEPVFEEPWTPTTTRPKLVRPGALLDTGDAMPCTEFHRPNPLDSDVIMDATARLLSSRRTPAPRMETGRSQHSEEGQRRRRRRRGSGQQASESAEQPHKSSPAGQPRKSKSADQQPKKAKSSDQPKKAKSGDQPKKNKPADQQPKKARDGEQPKKGRRDGQHQRGEQPRKNQQEPSAQKRSSSKRNKGGNRRGMPPEPQRSHPKDSTEQPSLMKPYYLDLGR